MKMRANENNESSQTSDEAVDLNVEVTTGVKINK